MPVDHVSSDECICLPPCSLLSQVEKYIYCFCAAELVGKEVQNLILLRKGMYIFAGVPSVCGVFGRLIFEGVALSILLVFTSVRTLCVGCLICWTIQQWNGIIGIYTLTSTFFLEPHFSLCPLHPTFPSLVATCERSKMTKQTHPMFQRTLMKAILLSWKLSTSSSFPCPSRVPFFNYIYLRSIFDFFWRTLLNLVTCTAFPFTFTSTHAVVLGRTLVRLKRWKRSWSNIWKKYVEVVCVLYLYYIVCRLLFL